MLAKSFLAVAATASCVTADTIMGFNYASAGQTEQSFSTDFKASGSLSGAKGFNSARLYTMIQDGTTNTPISAIPAAIHSKGTLLLGLWASAGQASFDNELAALKSAIQQYGKDFADAVVGISVGSEDLYRITDTSTVVNKDPNPGAAPDTLVSYIKQVRDSIKNTVLADAPVGHVDTYTAYINSSNQAVIDNSDFCGMDAYPYYQTTEENGIDQAYDLFFSAYDQTKQACGSKPTWVTETGWPTSGTKKYNKAVASVSNAETYWQKVGCALFGKTNVWWYTLADSGADPSFGVVANTADNKPLYKLSCDSSDSSSDSSSSSSSASSPSKTSGSGKSGSSDSSPTASGSSSSSSGTSGKGSDSSSGSDVSSSGGSAGATGGSSDSSSSSGSNGGSSSGSGSSGSDSGAGSASPSGGAAGNGTSGGITSVTTPSTPSNTGAPFEGAANRNAEIGVGAAALLMLAYFL